MKKLTIDNISYTGKFLRTQKMMPDNFNKLFSEGYWSLMSFFVRDNGQGKIEFVVITPPQFKKYKEGITRFGMELLQDYANTKDDK